MEISTHKEEGKEKKTEKTYRGRTQADDRTIDKRNESSRQICLNLNTQHTYEIKLNSMERSKIKEAKLCDNEKHSWLKVPENIT